MTTQQWFWLFSGMVLGMVLQAVVPSLWKSLRRWQVNRYVHVDRGTLPDKLSIRLVDYNSGEEINQVYLGKEIEEFYQKHNAGEGVVNEFCREHVEGEEGPETAAGKIVGELYTKAPAVLRAEVVSLTRIAPEANKQVVTGKFIAPPPSHHPRSG